MNAVLRRTLRLARSLAQRLVPQVEALTHRLAQLENRWGETNHEVTVIQRSALRRLQDEHVAMSTELLRLRAEVDQLHGEAAARRALDNEAPI
jgi:hypothetical protein